MGDAALDPVEPALAGGAKRVPGDAEARLLIPANDVALPELSIVIPAEAKRRAGIQVQRL